MADYYDDRPESGGGFMIGLFAGTLLGAGLGLLLAPNAGSELRQKLRERAGTWADSAEEGYRRATGRVSDLADRGRDLADRGREMGREVFERARETAGEAAGEAKDFTRDIGRS